jgi:TPR repeat protein
MESIFVFLGVLFVIFIALALFTDFGKNPSAKTNEQLRQLYPLHVKNLAAQKNFSPEAYKKALGEFAVFADELVKRGLRTDYEVSDFELAQQFVSDKFHVSLADAMRRAPSGDAEALYYLGAAKIATQEEESAFRLLTLAADQGHLESQYLLGHGYLNATRVPKDSAEGLKWFLLSATKGHKDAAKAVEVLEKELPQDILQKAQEEALNWMKERGIA